MFDYLMAGLVVVASDLPSLRSVITKSGGGLLYRSGDTGSLVEKIMVLYQSREVLDKLSSCGRAFALTTGNREFEMRRFKQAFRAAIV